MTALLKSKQRITLGNPTRFRSTSHSEPRPDLLSSFFGVRLRTFGDLLDEPDRHRVTIEFSVTGLDGGDDAGDGVQIEEGIGVR